MDKQVSDKYFKIHERSITKFTRENGEVFYVATVVQDAASWLWGLIKFRPSYVVATNSDGPYLCSLSSIGSEYLLMFAHHFTSENSARLAVDEAIAKKVEDIRSGIIEEIKITY